MGVRPPPGTNKTGWLIFFSFPMISGENYNVLFGRFFFGHPAVEENGFPPCVLREWLTSEESVQANFLMHRLCRRAFAVKREAGSRGLF